MSCASILLLPILLYAVIPTLSQPVAYDSSFSGAHQQFAFVGCFAPSPLAAHSMYPCGSIRASLIFRTRT